MEYDNTNRGVLFPNEKKGNDKAPSMKGKLNVDGGEYYLSAWTKTNSKTGSKFLSLSIQPASKVQASDLPEDDGLPF